MNTFDDAVREWVSGAMSCYISDLSALTHEQLAASPAGHGRAAYDYSYEVAVVNDRIAQRMCGAEPEAWPFEGWVICPDEYRDPEKISARVADSLEKILAAWDGLSAEDRMKPIQTQNGTQFPVGMMHFASMHTMYHGGQLNLVQAMAGDLEVHWS